MNVAGKMRPPRNSELAATSRATILMPAITASWAASYVAAVLQQLADLLEALEHRDRAADEAEDAEEETADGRDEDRVPQRVHRAVDDRERGERGEADDRAPHATITPVSRSIACGPPYGGRSNAERRRAQQVHRDRPGARRDQRQEQPVPERRRPSSARRRGR